MLSIAEIQQLASLPSKEELISKIMFLLGAPAPRIASALAAVNRNLAVTVNEAVKANKFGSDATGLLRSKRLNNLLASHPPRG